MDIHQAFNIPSNLVQSQKLLSFIDQEWLANRENWVFIGQCLYNAIGQQALALFERYSPSHFEPEIRETWLSYEKTMHGMFALKTLARRRSNNRFKQWQQETVLSAAIGALQETASITELADITMFLFGDMFVCSDVGSQRWWHFTGSIWQSLSGGHSMKQKFSRELAPIFQSIYGGLAGAGDDIEVKMMKKKCIEIIRSLKDPGGKQTLMRECAEIFYVDDFENNCDEDRYILGLPNGVYDLQKMKMREAYPEDLLTLQMGVPYDEGLSWESDDVIYMMDFYKKVLYKEDLIDFSLKHKSTCLVGGNLNKKLVMNIGETAHNAKTTCATLDRHTFGKYSGKLPLGVLVGQTPKVGEANPALAGTKGTRLQQIDEANKNQRINMSFMKTGTGNDEIWARKLYSNGGTFAPQFTLIMYANEAPDAKSCVGDDGSWERFVWLPHDSRFTSDAPDSIEKQWKTRTFKADRHIDIQLKKRAYAYLWILVEKYKQYLEDGGELKEPDDVLKRNAKYKYSSDIYMQFKDNKIEIIDSRTSYVPLADLYIAFKLWYNDAGHKGNIPSREDFMKEISRLIGDPVGFEKRFNGMKIKNSEVRRFDRANN